MTVALRGESAQRLRALAAAQEMTLSKLLVRMMEVFEAQAIQRGRDAAQRELPLPPRCAILASILSLGRGIVPRPRALGDL